MAAAFAGRWPGATDSERTLLADGKWMAWNTLAENDHWDRYVGGGGERRRQTITRIWWGGGGWEITEQYMGGSLGAEEGEEFASLEECAARADVLRGSDPIVNPYIKEDGTVVLHPDLPPSA